MRHPFAIPFALLILTSCGSDSNDGPGGNPPPGSSNPCSYALTGDIDDRVDLNAHFGLRRRGGLARDKFDLIVSCIRDPPGSQYQGIVPAIEIPFEGVRDYVVNDATPGSGRVIVGNRAGSIVYFIDGDGKEPGTCTVTVTRAPGTPAKVGDRVDGTFRCEGLTTESSGKRYVVDLVSGVFGGTVEAVEP